jgi:hypothetical protein
MTVIGPYLAAAMLLAVAGMSKAVRPADSGLALARLAPVLARFASPIVRILAVAEAGVGVLALVWLAPLPADLVAASYGAFTIVVLVVRARGGPLATCGCFGGIDTPPTIAHVVIDAAAAVAAVAVSLQAPGRYVTVVLGAEPLHGIPLLFGSAVTAMLAFAVMSLLGRVQSARIQLRQGTVAAGSSVTVMS